MSAPTQRGKFPPWTGTVAIPVAEIDPARLRQIFREKAEEALDRWGPWRGFQGSIGLRDAVADAIQKAAATPPDETQCGRLSRKVIAESLAGKILSYFDRYQLGSAAPIVADLEKALAGEYRRGLEEAGCWRESP